MTVGDSDLRIRPGRIRSTRAAETEELHQPGATCREEGWTYLASGCGWQAFRSLWALDVRPRSARV